MKEKVLAMVLSLSMMATLLPTTALATEGTSLLTIDGDFIYANGNALVIEDGTISIDDEIVYTGDLSNKTILGGGVDGVVANTSITVVSGEVGTIYAGGSAIITAEAAEFVSAMETILSDFEAAMTTALGLSDADIAALEEIVATLENILTNFENKVDAGEMAITDIIALLEDLNSNITDTILPYMGEASADYLSDVATALLEELEADLTAAVNNLIDQAIALAVEAMEASIYEVALTILGLGEISYEDMKDFVVALEDLVEAVTALAEAASVLSGDSSAEYTEEDLQAVIDDYGSNTYFNPDRILMDKLLAAINDDTFAVLDSSNYYDFTGLSNSDGAFGSPFGSTYSLHATQMGLLCTSIYTDISGYSDALENIDENLAAFSTAVTDANDALTTLTTTVAYEEIAEAYPEVETIVESLSTTLEAADTLTDIGSITSLADLATLFSADNLAALTALASFDFTNLTETFSTLTATIETVSTIIALVNDISSADDITDMIASLANGDYEIDSEALSQYVEIIYNNFTQRFDEAFVEDYVMAIFSTMETSITNFSANWLAGDVDGLHSPTQQVEAMIEAVLDQLAHQYATAGEIYAEILAMLDFSEIMALAEGILADSEALTMANVAEIVAAVEELIYNSEAALESLYAVELALIEAAEVAVQGGTVGTIYGGGYGAGIFVTTTNITVSGGTVSEIYESAYDLGSLDLSFTEYCDELEALVAEYTDMLNGDNVYLVQSGGTIETYDVTNYTNIVIEDDANDSDDNDNNDNNNNNNNNGNSNSGSGNSSSGNDSSSDTTAPTETTTSTETTTTVGNDGSVTTSVATTTVTAGTTSAATVTDSAMESAIETAIQAAADNGEKFAVEIPVATSDDTTSISAAISVEALTTLVERGVESLVIASNIGTVEIPAEALAAMLEQAEGDSLIVIAEQKDVGDESLTDAQKELLEESATLILDLTVISNNTLITGFHGFEVTITVPYELNEGESSEDLVIWYIDDDGYITPMDTLYDEETQAITFSTDHFSVYVVLHDTNPFSDVSENAYYYHAIQWAVEHSITDGDSDTTFSPDAICTRAQAVTFLWRAAGAPVIEVENPFTDLSEEMYYYDAVLWAISEGITIGTTSTTFSPERICSRGEIATLLWRLAGQPEGATDTTFDDLDVTAYYYDAVLWAYENGITNGTSATTFAPSDDCTRASIITLLYRYYS